MTKEEKIGFLKSRIQKLNEISKELEEAFPEKSFALDGILIGNIVEEMVSLYYGVELFRQSEKTHDGEVNGKRVQIKGTQKLDYIVLHGEPEHLIVVFLDKEKGTIKEIYNGPGTEAVKIRNKDDSISVKKLIALNQTIPQVVKILSTEPVDLYETSGPLRVQSAQGRTTRIGYINSNNQENLGCLNKPGTHPNQTSYLMKCRICGYEYEANGCDIAVRKCPKLHKKKLI